MPEYFEIPVAATLTFAVGVFLGALLSFHLLFVVWFRIGKLGWKIVDYFWLGFAALGLIGASGQATRLVATSHLSALNDLAPAIKDPVQEAVSLYAGNGYLCRTFIRSEWSPPPEEFARNQGEFDAVCKWFKDLAPLIPKDPFTVLNTKALPPAPVVNQTDLKAHIKTFHEALAQRERVIVKHLQLAALAKSSDGEQSLTYLSPLLTALALALRFTKVTGEIMLDRRQAATSSSSGTSSASAGLPGSGSSIEPARSNGISEDGTSNTSPPSTST